MAKFFNVNGACDPNMHYMVDLTSRLEEISEKEIMRLRIEFDFCL